MGTRTSCRRSHEGRLPVLFGPGATACTPLARPLATQKGLMGLAKPISPTGFNNGNYIEHRAQEPVHRSIKSVPMIYGIMSCNSSLPRWLLAPSRSNKSQFDFTYQLTRLSQQVPQLPAFLERFAGIQTVFLGIRIAQRGAGPRRPTVHAASFFATHRGRHAWLAGSRLRPATRARQHRASITRMVASHCFFCGDETVLPHGPVRQ